MLQTILVVIIGVGTVGYIVKKAIELFSPRRRKSGCNGCCGCSGTDKSCCDKTDSFSKGNPKK